MQEIRQMPAFRAVSLVRLMYRFKIRQMVPYLLQKRERQRIGPAENAVIPIIPESSAPNAERQERINGIVRSADIPAM